MIRAFAIAIGVALLFGAPALAFAKPRVAIVAFDDDDGELQDLVADVLDGTYSIIATSKVTRAMDRLGFDVDMTSKQLKKLAAELEASTIIRGEVNKRGGHRVLHLRLWSDGKKVRGFRIEFASARSTKFRDALKEKLLERLSGSEPVKAPAEEPAETPVEEPVKTAEPAEPIKPKGKHRIEATVAEHDEPTDTAKEPDKDKDKDTDATPATGEDDEDPVGGKAKGKGKKTAARGDGEDEEGSEGEVEEHAPTRSSAHTANRAAVRVDFGPSLSARSLAFTSRSFEEAPKPYSNSPVPGARIEGALYPLAFSNPNSFIAGLGFGGTYDKTLALNLQSSVQQGTKFPVTQSSFAVGPRLRMVFGSKPTSLSLTLQANYMARQFVVDRTKLMQGNIIDLPDVSYKGYSAGVDLRIPVAPRIALFLGGGAIFVTTTGAIQSLNEYGQAKVTGGEGRVGVDIGITDRMALAIGGDVCQMGFTFTGTGQMAINRDGDPSTKDVGGAADRYIGGSLTFGVLY